MVCSTHSHFVAFYFILDRLWIAKLGQVSALECTIYNTNTIFDPDTVFRIRQNRVIVTSLTENASLII